MASLGLFAGGSWVILAPAMQLLGAEAEMPVCLLCGWTSCRVVFGDTGIPKGCHPLTPPTCFWRKKRSPDGQVTGSMAEAALPSRGVSPPCVGHAGHGPHRVLRPPPAPRDTLMGRRSVRGWRCFGAGRCGLRNAHSQLPAAIHPLEPRMSQLQMGRRRRRCSEYGRGRLGLNAAMLEVKRVGLSTAEESQGPGGGVAWTNTSFQEMLETHNQCPVIQQLYGAKGTARDKGHRSTKTQPSINPG